MLTLLHQIAPPASVAAGYRKSGWWRDTTFVEDLERRAQQNPQRPAIINWRHTENREQVVTFGALRDHVASFACGLHRLGVRSGHVVVYQLPNWWENAALGLAIMRLGAVMAPVPMSVGAREVARAVAFAQAAHFVTVHHWKGRPRDEILRTVAQAWPTARRTAVGAIPSEAGENLTAPPDAVRQALPPALAHPDKVATVVFTSGTTGAAKGVFHSGNTHYAAVRQMLRPFTGDERPQTVATGASLGHTLGFQFSVLGPLVHGHTSVIWDEFHPATVLDLADRHHVRFLLLSPAQLRELTASQMDVQHELPDLRAVACTATPLSRGDIETACRAFQRPVINAYGTTETAGITCTRHDDPTDRAAHSIGRPRPGVEVRLVPDEEAGQSSGRALVRGPAVCLGTVDRDTAQLTWTPQTTGGWIDTGDLLRPDGHGGLRYVSRVAERVSGSTLFMIPVADVENELRDHPAVREVAVIGQADERYGELPCAVIVPQGQPPTLDELRAYLEQHGMTDSYLPARLVVVDELPQDSMGKVCKRLLRERLHTSGAAYDGGPPA
ncbi:AMP-binding protein [Kitasatospora sp. NPDC101235]|uniref:AMP-binding protein n=1 Tax=Kitasatospora sp. NPDC101235 TaxID=3364101 RepID=UPI0038249E58